MSNQYYAPKTRQFFGLQLFLVLKLNITAKRTKPPTICRLFTVMDLAHCICFKLLIALSTKCTFKYYQRQRESLSLRTYFALLRLNTSHFYLIGTVAFFHRTSSVQMLCVARSFDQNKVRVENRAYICTYNPYPIDTDRIRESEKRSLHKGQNDDGAVKACLKIFRNAAARV